MKHWGTISIILCIFLIGCATKGTLKVRRVYPWSTSAKHHLPSVSESVIIGGITTTFNDKVRVEAVIITDLSEEKYSGSFGFAGFMALPKGSYRIMSISIAKTHDVIEPTPFIFDVPDVGKTYYIGVLNLDLKGKLGFFIPTNRVEEIKKFDIVDNSVKVNDYLVNKHPAYEARIEKLLMKKDDQNGTYDMKIIDRNESKYKSMITPEEAGTAAEILYIPLLLLISSFY